MLKLNDLRDKPGSVKNRKRVGRGYSGDRPGHGGKGQTARTGVALGNFQGGQTPLERRLPKQKTFYTPDKMETVSLARVQQLINSSRFSNDIKRADLESAKVISKGVKYKVVGKCDVSLTIEANAVSSGALKSIEFNNGSFIKTK